MAQLIGKVSIDVTGLGRLRSKAGASLDFGGVNRKPVADDQGGINYAEEVVPGMIEATLLVGKDTDVEAIRNIVGATATFTADTGQVWTVANAFITEPPKLTGGEGELSVKLAGQAALKTK